MRGIKAEFVQDDGATYYKFSSSDEIGITQRAQINLLDEIIVDNFAGGGGASTGIELATGRPVTIAINHDPAAILMHKTNHPQIGRASCRGRV